MLNTSLSALKQLRMYRRFSFLQLFNFMMCNRVMKSRLLVAQAPTIYRLACIFPGKWITHHLVSATFNKFLTGGNSLESLQKTCQHLTQDNIPMIIDFCAQGISDHPQANEWLDDNAKQFALSASFAARSPNHTICFKITGIMSMDLLQKYNQAVLLRDKIWKEHSQQGLLRPQKLFESFQRLYNGVTEEDFLYYLKTIHNFQGEDLTKCSIDEVQFKMNHHPFYLYQPQKNNTLLVKVLFPLDQKELSQMQAFKRRLGEILDIQENNPNGLRVLCDAQQSYVQRAIESISEQLQLRYNKERVYLIPTLQNYLKISQKRLQYQLEIATRRKLCFGVKLVRGAYLVEESRLAKENNYESPIVDCFQKTTQNYLSNFARILKQVLKGEVFVAGHNEQTINALRQLKKQGTKDLKVNFAQLYGIGDHLTVLLKRQRQSVYKLVPWAQTQVMVPYMIRRGEELSQMRYPLETQFSLLRHQMFTRVGFS